MGVAHYDMIPIQGGFVGSNPALVDLFLLSNSSFVSIVS